MVAKDQTKTVEGEDPVFPSRDEEARGPLRRCAVTGQVLPKTELMRFVIGPDQVVVPDFAGKLPGRGIWLSPSRNVLEKACQKNFFARAAKQSARVPEGLVEQIETVLEQRCLDALGLARRAGQLTAGFEKVKAWLTSGKVGLMLQASDAAQDGKEKLQGLGRAIGTVPAPVELFSARQLGQALGRDAWVHVALRPGGIADAFAADVARLSALRTEPRDSR
ncbi:RNA-binding protein [Kiloniella sp. b19]|uniref:RNA-binding protein n=1 Tax=Kiloniella sp. GXU_MW_B19 TaxID=3141326 RepID=UPI0031D82F82